MAHWAYGERSRKNPAGVPGEGGAVNWNWSPVVFVAAPATVQALSGSASFVLNRTE